MSEPISELEGEALQRMLGEKAHLYSALCKYFAMKAEKHEEMCAVHMRTVPRDAERASDYAARSEEARLTMAQLESFARDL